MVFIGMNSGYNVIYIKILLHVKCRNKEVEQSCNMYRLP